MKLDPRNEDILVYMDGQIVHRDEARLSVWDAGFLHGKQIWSSPRLVLSANGRGQIFRLPDHLAKIRHGLEAIHCAVIPSDDAIIAAVRSCLLANQMDQPGRNHGVHIRIVVTPGDQITASMNQTAIVQKDGVTPSPPRIIVMPEYRADVYNSQSGVAAIVSQLCRRPAPAYADQRIHSNNQIHSSLACDEARSRGASVAILLDSDDHVAEAHASHLALVQAGILYTPKVWCCPPGVTRRVILELCAAHDIAAYEEDIHVSRLLAADEVMLLGTMSGPVGITQIDGTAVGKQESRSDNDNNNTTVTVGPVTQRLQALYQQAMKDEKNLFDIFATTTNNPKEEKDDNDDKK